MDPSSSNMVLIYRLFIKVMNTVTPNVNLNKSLIKDKRGETTVFKINPMKANVSVPRTFKWDEISVPTDWKLANEVPKKVPGADSQLYNIIENDDGSVIIRFGSGKSIKVDPFEE